MTFHGLWVTLECVYVERCVFMVYECVCVCVCVCVYVCVCRTLCTHGLRCVFIHSFRGVEVEAFRGAWPLAGRGFQRGGGLQLCGRVYHVK